MIKKDKKVLLVILDGWAHGPIPERSAIAQANTPFMDALYRQYPHCELVTHSEYVGLPQGQMGNSEVGHLHIGAGRVIYQELIRINRAIQNGDLKKNSTLQQTYAYCKKSGKNLHFIGLVSDGGVHSHIRHLFALCDLVRDFQLAENQVFVHAFTDGRDCDPRSGAAFLEELEGHLKNSRGKLVSVCGRYYAMDRDKRWERIKLAYDMLTAGKGRNAVNLIDAVKHCYEQGETDEFIRPLIKQHEFVPISEGDAVICFNFRTDRCREITQALTQREFPEHGMKPLQLHYVTMTNYDPTFKNVHPVFDNEDLNMTLGEVLSRHGKTQIRAAETEKYPHVTYFFSGGREEPFPGETRILIPSPKVATYDLQPEMSALPLTERILDELDKNNFDFYCINYANTDMVGHTGVFSAAVKAAETVDTCVARITSKALEKDYSVIVTADHGNADYMINDDGSPHTAHTLNPVPFILIDKELKPALHNGTLADIAPTILKLMGIPQPEVMTGKSLY
ncbi:MAG: 2,3-bisphosphoglycerate-independent phosphoglycerate mutase [Chitinophagales bacterium]|nr:2,3-bisphosphoglycerate-independent phosphoglycerate mutase [Chitinophagales bacterium]MDW8420000.1 2,3-bisphosphoglycerate-independent phosphoglycerate mutase [Chitinophagales bacterium]